MEKEEILMFGILSITSLIIGIILCFSGNILWAFVAFFFWVLFSKDGLDKDPQPKTQNHGTPPTEPAADSSSKMEGVKSSQCPNCGGKIELDALFCENCGIKLK